MPRRAWLPHIVEGGLRLVTAAALIGYEAHLNAHAVPTTWITILIVGILAGPLYQVGRAVVRDRLVARPEEQLLPEADAALRLGPLLREHGGVVLLEVEEAIRRRALTQGRRDVDER